MIYVNRRNLGEEPLFLARIYHIQQTECKQHLLQVDERWFTAETAPYPYNWEGLVTMLRQPDFYGCWLESMGAHIHISKVVNYRQIVPVDKAALC